LTKPKQRDAEKSSENLRIRRVSLDEIHHDPSNARTHDERNIDAIRASLAQFGQVEPLVIQAGTGRVIGGNGRLTALRAMGETSVDVVEVDIDDMGATALNIALNRTSDLSSFDNGALSQHLAALQNSDAFDAGVTGFDEREIRKAIDEACSAGAPVQDEPPEPPTDPITKRGDMWQLGRHRVLCGDATSEEDVARVLNGATPFIMVTDPPYGVEYDPAWRNEAAEKGSIGYGDRAVGIVQNDDRADWSSAYALFAGDVAYTWSPGGDHVLITGRAIQSVGFLIRATIIWRKARFAISRGAYHYQHEP
jgi:hypothetical protein